jgi:hypothetical protein
MDCLKYWFSFPIIEKIEIGNLNYFIKKLYSSFLTIEKVIIPSKAKQQHKKRTIPRILIILPHFGVHCDCKLFYRYNTL